MENLLDPNLAYLLLAGGLVLTALAILNPGTGVLEIAALVALIIAGYEIFNLPINWWALLVILVGLVMFAAAVYSPRQIVYLIVSIACLVLGSAFIFRSDDWFVPAVNPFLAAMVSVFTGSFFWVVARKTIEAREARPTHDLEGLLGASGEARTEIHQEGSVQVAGELWSARSEKPINQGTQVRVVNRDGFILIVEAVDKESDG